MELWINYLSSEGNNLARRAQEAAESGDYDLAIELYHKAEKKFREASEISEDSYEVNRLRYLANDYKIKAQKLEKELGASIVLNKPAAEKKESPTLMSGILDGT